MHLHLLRVRLTAAALLSTVLALGAAACGTDSNSSARSDPPPTPSSSAASPTEPATSTSTPASPTADLQPCDLLDESDLAALELELKGPEDVGGARTCEFHRFDTYTVFVGIWDDLTTDEVVSSGPTERTTIGRHPAVRFTGGISSCAFALDVGPARVDVVAAAGGDVPRACEVARKAALLVEPDLPA